ncbi:MAG: glycosyltransferase family 2 protein, partial [Candidatus Saccharimonadales bacterium]
MNLEIIMWAKPLGPARRPIAGFVIVALAVVSGYVVGRDLAVWTLLLLVGSIYRIINLLRLVKGLTHQSYLIGLSRRTSLMLIFAQAVVAGLTLLDRQDGISYGVWLYGIGFAQYLFVLVILGSTLRHVRTTRLKVDEPVPPHKLPPLSVAIPARNETEDLQECLRTLIDSDYPKLEIIVLDDCSQNKRTPGIIRDFAHAGVVFLSGKQPPKQWLAKNYAYEQLVEEANGELILFCGVDTRFKPDTLHALVSALINKQKSMASFVPLNAVPKAASLESLLVQPMRYGWELALPRRLLNRPPVLSTCWLISRRALIDAGGFKAVARS